jgi:hypothetical protein
MKNFIVGSLIIGVAIVIGFVMSGNGKLGANPGPEYFNLQYFYGGLVQGGGELTLTSSATTTMTAKQICDNALVTWEPTTAAGDFALPSATTLAGACLGKVGATKEIVFWNKTETAATTTVFSTTTGMRLLIEGDTGAANAIAGTGRALLTFKRVDEGSSTTVDVYVRELIVQ